MTGVTRFNKPVAYENKRRSELASLGAFGTANGTGTHRFLLPARLGIFCPRGNCLKFPATRHALR